MVLDYKYLSGDAIRATEAMLAAPFHRHALRMQGKGLGRTLFEETFRALPGERIQLEVEAINPAGRLYERMGFAEERRFRLRGVEWRVMVRCPERENP